MNDVILLSRCAQVVSTSMPARFLLSPTVDAHVKRKRMQAAGCKATCTFETVTGTSRLAESNLSNAISCDATRADDKSTPSSRTGDLALSRDASCGALQHVSPLRRGSSCHAVIDPKYVSPVCDATDIDDHLDKKMTIVTDIDGNFDKRVTISMQNDLPNVPPFPHPPSTVVTTLPLPSSNTSSLSASDNVVASRLRSLVNFFKWAHVFKRCFTSIDLPWSGSSAFSGTGCPEIAAKALGFVLGRDLVLFRSAVEKDNCARSILQEHSSSLSISTDILDMQPIEFRDKFLKFDWGSTYHCCL